MALKDELQLNAPLQLLQHEALLNIYHTASCIKKSADVFFKPFGVTDVQFNVLMLLKYQCAEEEGLSQADISKMMLVNRANVTSIVDRMEKNGLVKRTAAKNDRRFNIIKMTTKGSQIVDKVEGPYIEMIKGLMGKVKQADQKSLIKMLEKLREGLTVE